MTNSKNIHLCKKKNPFLDPMRLIAYIRNTTNFFKKAIIFPYKIDK